MRPCALVVLGLALAAPALAATHCPPMPQYSTIPQHVALAGLGPGGAAAALGRTTVVVRDLVGNPYPSSSVAFDFQGCPDCRIAGDPSVPDQIVDCANRTVRALSDRTGTASLVLLGGAHGLAGTPGPSTVTIYADGVFFGKVPAAIYDLDGRGGIDVADLAVWAHDYLSSQYYGRSDYDGDGVLGCADLALWGAAFVSGRSTQSAESVCP